HISPMNAPWRAVSFAAAAQNSPQSMQVLSVRTCSLWPWATNIVQWLKHDSHSLAQRSHSLMHFSISAEWCAGASVLCPAASKWTAQNPPANTTATTPSTTELRRIGHLLAHAGPSTARPPPGRGMTPAAVPWIEVQLPCPTLLV